MSTIFRILSTNILVNNPLSEYSGLLTGVNNPLSPTSTVGLGERVYKHVSWPHLSPATFEQAFHMAKKEGETLPELGLILVVCQ